MAYCLQYFDKAIVRKMASRYWQYRVEGIEDAIKPLRELAAKLAPVEFYKLFFTLTVGSLRESVFQQVIEGFKLALEAQQHADEKRPDPVPASQNAEVSGLVESILEEVCKKIGDPNSRLKK
jgi:hypothetical protein